MVARRLYTLENLGVPVYEQLSIVHEEFPTLTAHTRQMCQIMATTILSAVKNEIHTAFPYMRCYSLGIGTGRASTEIKPATESSSMSLIPPSVQDSGINVKEQEEIRLEDESQPPDIHIYNTDVDNVVANETLQLEVSTSTPAVEKKGEQRTVTEGDENIQLEDEAQPPEIQIYETDVNDNEVIKQTLQLEASTSTPAVEKKEEKRIATTKYERKKRTTRGRSTRYDSTELLPIPQLTRQQPKELHSPSVPAKQVVQVKSTVICHDDAKKTTENTSVPKTLKSASSHQYTTSADVQDTQQSRTKKLSPVLPTVNDTLTDRRREERHRVLTSPRRSTPLTYGRRDHHTRQDIRASHDRSSSSGRDRKASRRSTERSRHRESTQFRHGHTRDDRDWRPPTTSRQQEQGRFEIERFRREMLDEMRKMLQHAKK